MRPSNPFFGLIAVTFCTTPLSACSGASTNAPNANAATADAGAVDASPSTTAIDAGPDLATCTSLSNAAQTQLEGDKDFLACESDSDCQWGSVDSAGLCALPCGWATSQAGQASMSAAAVTACLGYNALGCPAPETFCQGYAGAFALCATGTCTPFALSMPLPAPAAKVGECTTLEVDFGLPGFSVSVPHAVTIPLSASAGTLYTDTTCTTSLGAAGALAVPSGAIEVLYGFVPQTSGPVTISTNGKAFGAFTVE